MKHPQEESWSDYVRGAADSAAVRELDEHLSTGCSECAQKVSALERVFRVSQSDRELEIPVAALRAARNVFRIQQLLAKQATPSRSLRIAFDSLLAPATSGVRGGASPVRHLVFESDEMSVDLQIEPSASDGGLRVVGQVLDSVSNPIAEVPAFLHQGGRVFAQDLTGGLGEFSLANATSGSSHLCFLVGDDEVVDLALPAFSEASSQE